eukprot:m.642216 g.642216  ORF g.642216 m.642216 type:complete len:266 (+) comp22637_c1_seq2:325-1122(+)
MEDQSTAAVEKRAHMDGNKDDGRFLVHARTCVACRMSKVKCDREAPCRRCIRLGLACVTILPRQYSAKRRKVDGDGCSIEASKSRLGVDARSFLVEPKKKGKKAKDEASSKEVSTIISNQLLEEGTTSNTRQPLLASMRIWFAMALRRRSVTLLIDTMHLAAKSNISLDELTVVPLRSTATDAAMLHEGSLSVPTSNQGNATESDQKQAYDLAARASGTGWGHCAHWWCCISSYWCAGATVSQVTSPRPHPNHTQPYFLPSPTPQ